MPKRTSVRDSELLRDLERVARRLQRERGEPPPPRVSNHDLLEDLLRVARKLRKPTVHALTAAEYDARGHHSASTVRMQFGSWSNALSRAADAEPIMDLNRVHEKLGGSTLTQAQYAKHGRLMVASIIRRFKSWRDALCAARIPHRFRFGFWDNALIAADLRHAA